MSDGTSIWKQTIAGVISGVVLIALGWAAGFLHTVWAWIVSIAMFLWTVITFELTVPLWLIFITIAIVTLGSWLAFRPKAQSDAAEIITPNRSTATEPALGELESDVIRALV